MGNLPWIRVFFRILKKNLKIFGILKNFKIEKIRKKEEGKEVFLPPFSSIFFFYFFFISDRFFKKFFQKILKKYSDPDMGNSEFK